MADRGSRRGTAASFVGRERELEELRAGLDDALAGRGRLFLISGDPGIGKTRLADEIAAEAETRGARVCWGRCWEGGGAPASWPWTQILRSLVRVTAPADLAPRLDLGAAWVAQLVPEIGEHLPGVHALPELPSSLAPERARFHMFDAVTTFLRNTADQEPLVLFFDDLHEADALSLLMLRYFARESRESRVLTIGAYQEAKARAEPQIGELVADLARDGRPLRLAGLSQPNVGRLVANMTGAPAGEGLVSAIFRATEGNPFFVEAVVRLLMSEGGWQEGQAVPDTLKIPDEVRESIRRRIRPLSTEAREVLSIASVLGREFDHAALSAVSDLPLDRIFGIMEEARSAAIVAEVSAPLGRFRFAHALIRETMYEGLLLVRRIELHQRVGHALETIHQTNLEPHLAELAHHFFEAIPVGETEKAIDYAVSAGRRAMTTLAWEEAIKEYERARLALELGAPDDPRRLQVLLGLGDAFSRSGDSARSREMFLQAGEIARRTGGATELARAASGYLGESETGSADAAGLSLLEEALASLGAEDEVLRARLMARLGTALIYDDQLERSQSLLREAVKIARQAGDPATLAYALYHWHLGLFGEPGTIEERLSLAAEVIRLGQGANRPVLLVQGHITQATNLLERGAIQPATVEIEAASRLAEELQQVYPAWFVAVLRAAVALLGGSFDEAERLIHAALALGRGLPSEDATNVYGAQTFMLRKEQGRLSEVEPAVRASAARYPNGAGWRCVLAHAYTELGRTAEARDAFDRLAAKDFSDLPKGYIRPVCLTSLSLACSAIRDTRRAGQLYEILRPWAGFNVPFGFGTAFFGAGDRYLGLLAATLSRWQIAAEHFEAALEMNDRMGARPVLADTRYDYARMLLARNGSGDRAKAEELLQHALGTASELGMKSLEAKLAALQSEAGEKTSARPEPRPEPDAPENVFRKEGELWTIAWQGRLFRLKDMKGLEHISRLLREPGGELHSSDLLAELALAPGGGSHARAGAALRERLRELKEELEEAERFHDTGRASKAREQIDSLGRELAAIVGLGPQARTTGQTAERARLSVTRAIRNAITRIREVDPSLGHHLSTSIRTGHFCSYRPDPSAPVRWLLTQSSDEKR